MDVATRIHTLLRSGLREHAIAAVLDLDVSDVVAALRGADVDLGGGGSSFDPSTYEGVLHGSGLDIQDGTGVTFHGPMWSIFQWADEAFDVNMYLGEVAPGLEAFEIDVTHHGDDDPNANFQFDAQGRLSNTKTYAQAEAALDWQGSAYPEPAAIFRDEDGVGRVFVNLNSAENYAFADISLYGRSYVFPAVPDHQAKVYADHLGYAGFYAVGNDIDNWPFQYNVLGEAQPRVYIGWDGSYHLGDGTNPPDADLYRLIAGQLATHGAVVAIGSGDSVGFGATEDGDAWPRYSWMFPDGHVDLIGAAGINFGAEGAAPGGDVSVQRVNPWGTPQLNFSHPLSLQMGRAFVLEDHTATDPAYAYFFLRAGSEGGISLRVSDTDGNVEHGWYFGPDAATVLPGPLEWAPSAISPPDVGLARTSDGYLAVQSTDTGLKLTNSGLDSFSGTLLWDGVQEGMYAYEYIDAGLNSLMLTVSNQAGTADTGDFRFQNDGSFYTKSLILQNDDGSVTKKVRLNHAGTALELVA